MATQELQNTWAVTEAYLRDAAAQLPEEAKRARASLMEEFNAFLNHNEFEMALDMLDLVIADFEGTSLAALKSMAKAAAHMGLVERQHRYENSV